MKDKKPEQDPASEFRSAVKDIEPLRHDKVAPHRRRRTPRPMAVTGNRAASPDTPDDALLPDIDYPTGEFLSFMRPGIQRRLLQDLCRGRIPIDRELDLHGLTVMAARKALLDFVSHCLKRGDRSVLIVHGKGHSSPERQPVLKRRVNGWLQQLDTVLAFCSARPPDGGTGAVYALLRRRRRQLD